MPDPRHVPVFVVGGRVGRVHRSSAWRLPTLIVALAMIAACGSDDIDPRAVGADPGRTVEALYDWPDPGEPLPEFSDVTEEWGLGDFENDADFQAAGGVAIGDLDGDGWPDLAVAGRDLFLFYGSSEGMTSAAAPIAAAEGQMAGVGIADLDGDAMNDLLVSVIGGDDLIIWGGLWSASRDPSQAPQTVLAGGTQTVALLAADLSGDERPDILRLSHDPAEPDIIWEQTGLRRFVPKPLPQSFRRSFAAEIIDLDQDGLLDIWVTRDVGWITGADSIYTRRGERDGPWIDVASDMGAALAIDGMGIALADLDGDGDIDAYVTDIGENDILFAGDDGYAPATSSGAGRIRPPGGRTETVSSSWAVVTGDINLDGVIDLVVANGGFGGADIVNKISGTEFVDLDTPAMFLGLGEGRFADVWPQLGQSWREHIRGMALGDLDLDGDADLVFVSSTGGMRVYRNEATGSSVTLVVSDAACGAGFIATVTGPTTYFRSVLVQHPFLSASEPSLTVGTLGGPVEISVIRPGLSTFTDELPGGSGRVTVEIPCR